MSWCCLYFRASLSHASLCRVSHTVYIRFPCNLTFLFLLHMTVIYLLWSFSASLSLSLSLSMITGKPLNHPCSFDEQCHLVNGNSHCANATVCKCIHGFLSLNGSCHNLQERNKNSSTPNEINLEMLPIMIVLGLMFIGMCVALNMFSR